MTKEKDREDKRKKIVEWKMERRGSKDKVARADKLKLSSNRKQHTSLRRWTQRKRGPEILTEQHDATRKTDDPERKEIDGPESEK